MSTPTHQWKTFHKGRLKIQACACCGEMCLPSNIQGLCANTGIMSSPIIKAGYRLFTHESYAAQNSQKVA